MSNVVTMNGTIKYEGDVGPQGVGISSISKTGTSGLVDTYTVTLTNNETSTFTVTNGEKGDTGNTGATGVGISSITRTSGDGSPGTTDTYTITLTNGNTSTFTVTNGANGTNGTNGTNGVGISSIEKTGTAGLVDTYTITLTNSDTSTFTVTNGQNGTNGTNGTDGVGISSISKTGTAGLVDTYTITLTNGNTSTFTVTNGQTQDISGKEDSTNKVTSISSSSTDTQYPSAKSVYDFTPYKSLGSVYLLDNIGISLDKTTSADIPFGNYVIGTLYYQGTTSSYRDKNFQINATIYYETDGVNDGIGVTLRNPIANNSKLTLFKKYIYMNGTWSLTEDRYIEYSTTDLTAGTSSLPTGSIYLVYE